MTANIIEHPPLTNTDSNEINKFSALASRWWDPDGELKTLHHINPVRLQYIEKFSKGLKGKLVADIGCGGGILSESMAEIGAQVSAIDASKEAIEIARLHQIETNSKVEYIQSTAEEFAEQKAHQFDIITCMEMLEHVPSPESVISACVSLVKPGGYVFLSTLNRNPKAYLQAVFGAEYVLNLLPKGTHDYQKFIKPSELAAWLRANDLDLCNLSGMSYNPLTSNASITQKPDVNYLLCAQLSNTNSNTETNR